MVFRFAIQKIRHGYQNLVLNPKNGLGLKILHYY
jgi:hypothetical protein